MEHRKVSIMYQKFKMNEASYIFICQIWNLILLLPLDRSQSVCVSESCN